MAKQVDIIIPFHNRLDHSRQTLESLFKNTNPELYNLYLVDDVSTDGTREYVQKHAGIAKVFINEENIGPAASRNNVCKYITENNLRSKYLYHSDNDVFFKEGWLEALLKVMNYSDLMGGVNGAAPLKLLGGGCHPYLQNNQLLYANDTHMVGYKDAVSGYSQLMTWETWDKYGPFDEGNRNQDIKIMGSEDWAFCQRIIKDGFLVGSIEPEVVIATGKTNTYGNAATGSETFKDVEGVVVK